MKKSYVATAVVSASSAVTYFSSLAPEVPKFWLPVAVLAFFALLNLLGISESSVVALFIFAVHMLTLSILMVVSLVYLFEHGWPMFLPNWSSETINKFGDPFKCIALGFGAALLGVSGFESSSNYVEEQEPGVFPKVKNCLFVFISQKKNLRRFETCGLLLRFSILCLRLLPLECSMWMPLEHRHYQT